MAEWQAAHIPSDQPHDPGSILDGVSEEKKRELLLLLSSHPLPATIRPRRPSLDFLKEQQEALRSAPMILVSHSVLPPITSSLSSSIDSTTPSVNSSNPISHEDPFNEVIPTPFQQALPQPLPQPPPQPLPQPLPLAEIYNPPELQERPNTQSSRLDTAASFLIGRSTDSGRIRFTQNLKPAEEILRKRLDELEVAIEEEELSETEDDRSRGIDELEDTLDGLLTANHSNHFPSTIPSTIDHFQVKNRENEANEMSFVEDFDHLPEIEGLQEAIDLLGSEKIRQLYDHCREEDPKKSGFLPASKILKAFIDLVPGAVRRKSVWRRLIIQIAPKDDQIAYGKLFAAIHSFKMQFINESETAPSLAEAIVDGISPLLPLRPSSQQIHKEVIRRQVITELSVLSAQESNIDLNRLTLATNKTILEQEEMLNLIEKCGLSTALSQLKDRLFVSFRTHDGRFHFGAFVGCLERIGHSKIDLSNSLDKTP